MKKILSYILLLPVLVSCINLQDRNPYGPSLFKIEIRLKYPQEFSQAAREGVKVSIEDINRQYAYNLTTDASAAVRAELPLGLYRISVNDRLEQSIFNSSDERLVLEKDMSLELAMNYSKAGSLVIKEIYTGGCPMSPMIGNYQSDKYIMLHNNDNRTVYLDSLCFGTLAPYNSNASNPWGGIQDDFAPIIQAVWQFGGSGYSFPLEPGEDAVLCLNGAVDHTATYPLSVNLNKAEYFVCYNNVYFYNTTYHPAPGDKIRPERILEVVEKVGQANAYAISINSPTVIIFRPEGISMKEFVRSEGAIIAVPGSTNERVVAIPWAWILDGVEVFNGSASSNKKRIRNDVDAGYVYFSETYKGRSLVRRVDEEASATAGYEILSDTNNSTVDFYEREEALLHHE